MKKLFRIWVVFFLLSWVGYMGVDVIVSKSRGQEFDLITKGIKYAIFSVFISSAPMLSVYTIFPRSKYLDSNDTAKPTFKVACSSEIDIHEDFDFNRLKTEIAGKWLITFSDDVCHVLKFRTEWGFFKKWGAAAWLKFDGDTRKIQIECFPLAGTHDNNLARKMQKEIMNCMKLESVNLMS